MLKKNSINQNTVSLKWHSITFLLFVFLLTSSIFNGYCQLRVGLQDGSTSSSQEGYTLFSPLSSTETFLLNNCGEVVHTWFSQYTPGNEVQLLPNGDIIRMGKLDNDSMVAGGGGGIIERIDWFSNVLWTYSINTDTSRMHHDFELLPNGNILVMVWVARLKEEAIQLGRNPDSIATDFLWTEKIIELQPVNSNGAINVWEWDLWDHLIQEFDPNKANYGQVSENSQLMDINYNSSSGIADWAHGNSISYHQNLDQIIISFRDFNEFWIIDHSTSTEEASGHTGGNSNRGGDILFRWGNDETFMNGSASRKSFRQHSVNWTDPNSKDPSQKILLFNNGSSERPFSTVDEVTITLNQGKYLMNSDGGFISEDLIKYQTKNPEDFYATFLSSVQLLDNDHLFICDGPFGRLFEVDKNGEIVWEYISPITPEGVAGVNFELNSKEDLSENWIFSSYKYPLTYLNQDPSFFNFEKYLIEVDNTFSSKCLSLVNSNKAFVIAPNPITTSETLTIFSKEEINILKIYSTHGEQLITRQYNSDIVEIDLSLIPGNYILVINNKAQLLNVSR